MYPMPDCEEHYSTYRDEPFDRDLFFSFFPEFGDAKTYPSVLVESAGKRARFYCTRDNALHLDGEDRNYARALMTAHLIVLITRSRNLATSQTGSSPAGGVGQSSIGSVGGSGIISSASVGGVSVSMSVPDSQNAWAYWLNQTPYGMEYQAFLSQHVPAGIYGMGECHRVLR